MSIYSIAIEWYVEGEEYSYSWQDYRGEQLPVLPVDSIVHLSIDGDKYKWTLKVKEIITWYTVGKYVSIYMICEVINANIQKP